MTARAQPLPSTLASTLRDFKVVAGANLVRRVEAFHAWQNERLLDGLWPYSLSTSRGARPNSTVSDSRGCKFKGINFGSQDYLSLSRHPAVRMAAHEAIECYGVHSAGSPSFVGGTAHSVALEKRMSEFLGMERTVLFPTGFAAGFGAVTGLVRSSDHVVIDALAHPCLQEGALAATRNVHRVRHLDLDSMRSRIRSIRAHDTANGVLVVTEGLFSIESDTPDIAAVAELCREFDATLLIDVAHDLGCLGENGRGQLELQNMLGKVDIVMGSFSKTFASNGGFVATRSRAVQQYLRCFSATTSFSNALSPIQAAIVLRALGVIESPEGAARRAAVMRNVLSLRGKLGAAGLDVCGEPSPVVSVKMKTEALARLVSRQLVNAGMIANLIEFPLASRGQGRIRLLVMAEHAECEIAEGARLLEEAYRDACIELEELVQPAQCTVA
ncbi:MAG: aminotransferase class I/II-fold pyridoxal phosphate-dependent enzyme [Roseiarcus sp.]